MKESGSAPIQRNWQPQSRTNRSEPQGGLQTTETIHSTDDNASMSKFHGRSTVAKLTLGARGLGNHTQGLGQTGQLSEGAAHCYRYG